jgi:hypothetical protein
MTRLIPAQESAYRILKYAFDAGGLLLLTSHSGRGRTTIMRKLQEETGGGFVTAREFIETSANRHPLSLEETLYSAVAASLRQNKIVYVDDIDLIHEATSSCHFYPRGQYLETALLELSDSALRDGKKLVASTDGSIAQTFAKRSFSASIPDIRLWTTRLCSKYWQARNNPQGSMPRKFSDLRPSSIDTR